MTPGTPGARGAGPAAHGTSWGPVLRQYLRNVRARAPYFNLKAGDPVERFVAEADRHPVFRLTATKAPG